MHTPIVTASDCEGAGEMFQVGKMWMGEWGWAGGGRPAGRRCSRSAALRCRGQLLRCWGRLLPLLPPLSSLASTSSCHLAPPSTRHLPLSSSQVTTLLSKVDEEPEVPPPSPEELAALQERVAAQVWWLGG